MNAPFPFGFPGPTAFYLTFYVLTLVIHWAFMSYVLAGTAYTLAARVAGKDDNPLDKLLREWLPLMLSGAITAGIAPLLFVQILYQQMFYTANLLLFHRWMSILPSLIAGFYLLYLLRSKRFGGWPLVVRIVIALATFGCFAFVAWTWTENHLLSLDQNAWVPHFAAQRMFHASRELLPRLAMWFAMTFPNLAIILGWQLWYAGSPDPMTNSLAGTRRTASLALAGLSAFVIAAIVYVIVMSPERRSALTSAMALPYVIAALLGTAVQFAAWVLTWRSARLTARWLGVASAGAIVASVGIAVAREALRIASIDIAALYARHEHAASVGGLAAFLFFFVVCALLIALSIWLVRRGLRAEV